MNTNDIRKKIEKEKISDDELWNAGAGDHTMTGAEANAWNHGIDKALALIPKDHVMIPKKGLAQYCIKYLWFHGFITDSQLPLMKKKIKALSAKEKEHE